MSSGQEPSKALGTFVGFVWDKKNDLTQRIETTVQAADVSQAAALLKETYGAGFGVSVWKEEDARKPR